MKKFFIGSITVISSFLGVISIVMGIWWYNYEGRYPLEKQKVDLTHNFVEDFIQVTIPTVLWEDYQPVEILTHDGELFPSLPKYVDKKGFTSVYRDHEYTKYSVLTKEKFRKTGHLNKFTAKTVHVALFEASSESQPVSINYEAAEAAIKSFLDEPSDLSGINFTLETNLRNTNPEIPRTGPSLFPRDGHYILIDILRGTFRNNPYKKAILEKYGSDGIEKYRKNVIPFTPYLRAQVDGYFAINQNNEIERSYCRLTFHAAYFSRSMSSLKECLLRSLGLPNESYSQNALLLSNYNAEIEPYVTTRFMDGFSYTILGRNMPSALRYPKEVRFQAHERLQKLYESGQGITLKEIPGVQLSGYDKKMLRTLYAPDIKPGMTKRDITNLLRDKKGR